MRVCKNSFPPQVHESPTILVFILKQKLQFNQKTLQPFIHFSNIFALVLLPDHSLISFTNNGGREKEKVAGRGTTMARHSSNIWKLEQQTAAILGQKNGHKTEFGRCEVWKTLHLSLSLSIFLHKSPCCEEAPADVGLHPVHCRLTWRKNIRLHLH